MASKTWTESYVANHSGSGVALNDSIGGTGICKIVHNTLRVPLIQTTKQIYWGNHAGNVNGTQIELNDPLKICDIYSTAGGSGFSMNNNTTIIGDFQGNNNNTTLNINDGAQTVSILPKNNVVLFEVPCIVGNSNTPTVTAEAGAGTSPTISDTGTNLGGVIVVTTGTTPTANTVVCKLTYHGSLTYVNGCSVSLPAGNGNAAAVLSTFWLDAVQLNFQLMKWVQA